MNYLDHGKQEQVYANFGETPDRYVALRASHDDRGMWLVPSSKIAMGKWLSIENTVFLECPSPFVFLERSEGTVRSYPDQCELW